MADDSPFGLRSGPQAAKGVEVPSFSLPDDASFEQLRKQAKDLRDLAGAGVPGALELVAANHPQGAHAVTLTGAQLQVARHYACAPRRRRKPDFAMSPRGRRWARS